MKLDIVTEAQAVGRPEGVEFHDSSVVIAYRYRPPIPEEIFARLHEIVPDSCRAVLDAGCGTGVVARALADCVDRVDAVDPSSAMIATGRAATTASKINWITATMEGADLRPPYGLIVCAGSLHWMDLDIVMPRFADSLDPQGYLAIASQYEVTTWSEELDQLITRYSSNNDHHRYGLFPRIVDEGYYRQTHYLRTEPVATRQTVSDYIESLHSRSGLSRDRMSDPEGFDAELDSLLSQYATGAVVSFDVVGQLSWGKPGARGSQTVDPGRA